MSMRTKTSRRAREDRANYLKNRERKLQQAAAHRVKHHGEFKSPYTPGERRVLACRRAPARAYV